MIGIYLLALATEILRFGIIFHKLLGYPYRKGNMKYILLSLSFITYGSLSFFPQTYIFINLAISLMISFLSTLFLFNEKIYKLAIIYIPVSLATVAWDTLSTEIIKLFYQFDEDSLTAILIRQIICRIMLVLCISILWFALKKKGILYNLKKDRIPKSIYVLTLSGIFMTSFIITLSRLVFYNQKQSGMELSYLSLIVLSIIYQLICVTLIFLFNSREKYKSINRIREDYNVKQVEYYKALLVQDEDIRKFRHDIKNHMICIQELLKTDKLDAVKDYVKDICNNMDKIVSIYDTGSDIINTIINYYAIKGKEDNISIQVKGYMRPEFNIPMMHLCTVVSNVMSNAYEATLKLEEEAAKIIQVDIRSGTKFFEFIVKNPTELNRHKLENNMLTSKKDSKNHGFGIRNIREIVLKYDGEFHLIDELDSVTIKIVMKTA